MGTSGDLFPREKLQPRQRCRAEEAEVSRGHSTRGGGRAEQNICEEMSISVCAEKPELLNSVVKRYRWKREGLAHGEHK